MAQKERPAVKTKTERRERGNEMVNYFIQNHGLQETKQKFARKEKLLKYK